MWFFVLAIYVFESERSIQEFSVVSEQINEDPGEVEYTMGWNA